MDPHIVIILATVITAITFLFKMCKSPSPARRRKSLGLLMLSVALVGLSLLLTKGYACSAIFLGIISGVDTYKYNKRHHISFWSPQFAPIIINGYGIGAALILMGLLILTE